MDVLQKILDNVIHETFNTKKIFIQIITKKLREIGIVLSKKQQLELKEKIENTDNFDDFDFQIDEEEVLEYPSSLKDQLNKSTSITIDPKDLENICDKISPNLKNLFQKLLLRQQK